MPTSVLAATIALIAWALVMSIWNKQHVSARGLRSYPAYDKLLMVVIALATGGCGFAMALIIFGWMGAPLALAALGAGLLFGIHYVQRSRFERMRFRRQLRDADVAMHQSPPTSRGARTFWALIRRFSAPSGD